MKLYLDNAAAEPVDQKTIGRLQELFAESWANQEAAGYAGNQAAEQEKNAAKSLLSSVAGKQAADYSVLWGHAGTEVIQAAFRLIAQHYSGGRILYTAGDHAAVRASIEAMGGGFSGVEIGLTLDGGLDFASFERELDSDVICVCVPFVVSETGAVQDLCRVREVLKRKSSRALLFCDSIQGVGKISFDWMRIAPDFFTISGQKLGLPAGAALIYRKEWKKYGNRLRSEYHQISRVPVPFIQLLSERVTEMYGTLAERYERMCVQRERFLQILKEVTGEGRYHVTVPCEAGSPYIIHLLLHNGVQGAIIVRALTLYGISISYGSACDAETDRPSGVLLSMGYSREESYGALRISFSGELEEGQMYGFAEKLLKTIEEY